MAALAITRTDWGVAELRSAAKRAAHTKQGLRILAIAMVQDGYPRREAAQACGMDRQTLCDWVRRYNEAGIDGLADRSRSGRPASLTEAEQAQVAAWVEQGADLATDGVVRFRRVDLRDRVAGRFGVHLHERSVGKLLCRLGYRRLSVRPLHPKTDLAAQETFKTNFASLAREALGERAAGKPVEVWFQDEARVGQQGTLTRIWARLTKGSVERSSMECQTRASVALAREPCGIGDSTGPICSVPSARPEV
jgi:putative transposase